MITIGTANSTIIGKHKIPRYLYHITPSKNIGAIKTEGLSTTEDDLFGEGIFLFDIANFLKFWNKNNKNMNYAEQLLKYIGRNNTDVSLLRVNTENLDKTDIVIRNQETLFEVNNKYSDINNIYDAYNKKEISDSLMDEISIGLPAVVANQFDRKKLPIEYIYDKGISPLNIRLLGRTNFDYQKINIKKIFGNLLKNTKEKNFLDQII